MAFDTTGPGRARFEPPARLVLPNVEGLPPGGVTEMYSFDHDLGHFVSIGPASVTSDGAEIVADAGVGIVKAGWHCGGNPAPAGTTHDCPPCTRLRSVHSKARLHVFNIAVIVRQKHLAVSSAISKCLRARFNALNEDAAETAERNENEKLIAQLIQKARAEGWGDCLILPLPSLTEACPAYQGPGAGLFDEAKEP